MQRLEQRHIVMVNKAYPPWMGGIERHVKDIGEALSQRGWQVTALVCHERNQADDSVINGVRVIRVPRLGTLFSQPITWNYLRTLRDLKPDLIHVHVPFPLGWRAAQTVPQQCPAVCTWHSDIIRQQWIMPLLTSFEQRFLKRCNRVITTSPELLQSSKPLQKWQDKCEVIPLALPPVPDAESSGTAQQIQILNQRFPRKKVLFVGRLVGYKGLTYLIDAMEKVDADLLIAGDGPLRQELEARANRSPSNNRIHFLGSVDNPTRTALYRCADVFVLPSYQRSEAFGYVLLEAMTEGCPVITNDIASGVRWVNQHKETGLVVPPQNVDALRDAIQNILKNNELRSTYSNNARKRVETCFCFDETIQLIEKIYLDEMAKCV